MTVPKEAIDLAMSAEWLAARVPDPGGVSRVDVCNWRIASKGCWRAAGSPAAAIDVLGSVVGLLAPECPVSRSVDAPCAEGGSVLNADGDTTDRVVRLYRADEARLIEVGQAAEEFVLGERLVAFRTREASQGKDLNGDEDLEDDVMQVFDLVSERLFNTMNAVTPCPLEACDPRFPYRVQGDTVVYITAEAEQGGRDLNGDGDSTDLVKQVFNAREAARLAGPSGEAPGCVETIAAASGGICTTTGAACVADSECGAGACYLPPGGCIQDLESTCDTTPGTVEEGGDGVNPCGTGSCECRAGEFCVPIPGKRGEGTCHLNRGPCSSQDDCREVGGICSDTAADIHRLLAPVAAPGPQGGETLVSSGRCVRECSSDAECGPRDTCDEEAGTCGRTRGSCRTSDDCQRGFTCAPNLVTVAAADTDRDDLADPFDNCPDASNVDQADRDRDGAGDACDRMTCGNGVRELSEQCDDGNLDEGDGCSARCFTPIGELLAFFDASVRSGGLVGSGPGASAAGRLRALRNQLEALGRSFDDRSTHGTCAKLASVLERADGSPRPPDFVTGDDRPELADRIAGLQAALACEAREAHHERSEHRAGARDEEHSGRAALRDGKRDQAHRK